MKMRVGVVLSPIHVIDGVKRENDRRVEFCGALNRRSKLRFEHPLVGFATAFDPEFPSHETEGNALEQPGRHASLAGRGGGDVDVNVEDHRAKSEFRIPNSESNPNDE